MKPLEKKGSVPLFAVFGAGLGWWLSPAGFLQTPFATMTSSMLAFVLFSFTAYTAAFALLVCALDRDSPRLWHRLGQHRRVLLKRLAASALFLGAGIYLLRHRDIEGWPAALVVACALAGIAWCSRSSRFKQVQSPPAGLDNTG